MLERDINKLLSSIYSAITYFDGQKNFGQYDSLVTHDTRTERFALNSGNPDLSIIIPVMERPDRLSETLKRFVIGVTIAQVPTDIVIMDNSITSSNIRDRLELEIKKWITIITLT